MEIVKIYPPLLYNPSNNTFTAYLLEHPNWNDYAGHNTILTIMYNRDSEKWNNSKINVLVYDEKLKEKIFYVVQNNNPNTKLEDYSKMIDIDISSIINNIVVTEHQENIKYTSGEYSRDIKITYTSKLISDSAESEIELWKQVAELAFNSDSEDEFIKTAKSIFTINRK